METKEHQALHLMDTGEPAPETDEHEAARAALAEEWRAANPQTPEEIARFYQTAQGLREDLETWHAMPARQGITDMIVSVAQQIEAKVVVDIGCGAGHDLGAIHEALPAAQLTGIEPNTALFWDVLREQDYLQIFTDVAFTEHPDLPHPIEEADLLICIDVLEHVPDPEAFLSDIATRAKVGAILFEMTATFDLGTPLHLRANAGWHPGHCLEKWGWEQVDRGGRARVWRRNAETGRERTGLLLCAYRSVNADTMKAVLSLCGNGGGEHGWRLRLKTGDGMISRSRGMLATSWYRETNDDVALFIDDDVTFTPDDADHIATLCREGHDIICGAYPVHDGGHLAIRCLPGTSHVSFGPDEQPLEIVYAATGFLAIHRRVFDALIADLPLCHASQVWSYYQLFPFLTVQNESTGEYEVLSEDWGFCEMARRKGFRVWLDRTVILQHASTIPVSARNMEAVHAAIKQA